MNETNKFVDAWGDHIQAQGGDGNVIELIQISSYGAPELSPEQAIEFAKQLTELAREVKNEHR